MTNEKTADKRTTHMDPTVFKIVGGAIVSAILTIGGVSYSNLSTNDTQEVRIARLENTEEAMRMLTDQLALTNQNIALLNLKIAQLKEDLEDVEEAIDEGE